VGSAAGSGSVAANLAFTAGVIARMGPAVRALRDLNRTVLNLTNVDE
jgi:hypothetical protein